MHPSNPQAPMPLALRGTFGDRVSSGRGCLEDLETSAVTAPGGGRAECCCPAWLVWTDSCPADSQAPVRGHWARAGVVLAADLGCRAAPLASTG